MKSSNILIEKIKEFEGCKLWAYRDSKGVPTIGIGHTKGVKMGQAITMKQALSFLKSDMEEAESYVNRIKVAVTQGQFDALVDFAYNVGTSSLAGSTLLKYIREGKSLEEIQKQFLRWNKISKMKRNLQTGKTERVYVDLAGLTKRRQWEAQRYGEA